MGVGVGVAGLVVEVVSVVVGVVAGLNCWRVRRSLALMMAMLRGDSWGGESGGWRRGGPDGRGWGRRGRGQGEDVMCIRRQGSFRGPAHSGGSKGLVWRELVHKWLHGFRR